MSGKQWPPVRQRDEHELLWFERLRSEINEQHGAWLEHVRDGDDKAVSEYLGLVVTSEQLSLQASEPEPETSTIHTQAWADFVDIKAREQMSAVYSGDATAVARYAEIALDSLKFATVSEKA